MKYWRVVLMAGVAVLAGCTLIHRETLTLHTLMAPSVTPTAADGAKQLTVRVAVPEVPAAYDNRMMLVTKGEVRTYAGQAWDAPVDEMLAAALTRDLSRRLPQDVFVGADQSVRTDVEVLTNVHTFATVQDDAGSAVIMEMDVQVVDGNSRRILKAMSFRDREPLPALTLENTLAGYDAAWGKLVDRLTVVIGGR